ncbi:S1-C subfamily serine protease [Pedobacter africanus]|uniref:S1-C subfamily serine protease n=1 Tax=Pedobacter africanus TaxID=151894 RepID=A0ACC6KX39_9SPHI|nr:trypsin-like peptidase domain-containing protein [Pedobacter africanus]MDR6783776.1 S1-C subfamily serine protease [Pedobacter africanus]
MRIKIARIVKTILMLLLYAIMDVNAVELQKFKIEGVVIGLKSGSKLCLIIKKFGKIDTVATAVSQDGAFKFQNINLPFYPDFYILSIRTEFVENLELFLDKAGDVKINGTLKDWPRVKVSGSKTHEDFTKAEKIRKRVWDEDFAVKHPDRTSSLDTILNYSIKGIQQVVDQLLISDYIPAMLARWTFTSENRSVPFQVRKTYYEALSQKQKNSFYGVHLSKQIANWEKNVKWISLLYAEVKELKSISKDEVENQLAERLNTKIQLTALQPTIKKMNTADLQHKVEASTVILNLAFIDDGITKPSSATAYVVDESGICITGYHVGKEYTKSMYTSLSVTTASGKTYPVTEILSCSESDDLMIFKVDVKGERLSALPLGNKAEKGNSVFVIGHSAGNYYQFTYGKVSELLVSNLAGKSCNIMGITADFNIGGSGGPIVDEYGNVVGTVSRINGGMKVGIPVNELKKLIEFKK